MNLSSCWQLTTLPGDFEIKNKSMQYFWTSPKHSIRSRMSVSSWNFTMLVFVVNFYPGYVIFWQTVPNKSSLRARRVINPMFLLGYHRALSLVPSYFWSLSTTFRIMYHLKSAYLRMTPSCTGLSDPRMMSPVFKKTLKTCRFGRTDGLCLLILISARFSASPTREKNILETDYTIHGSTLRTVDNAKYLGVTIQSNLSWKPHINNITKRANSTLGFLRRNLRKCPSKIKEQAYRTYVRPTLEYASSVWDSSIKDQVTQIEKVQRRAARFTKADYHPKHSVTKMLNDLQWQTLQERRAHSKVIMLYRIVHYLVAIPASPPYLLLPSSDTTRGHQFQFRQQHCRIQAYQHSFFPSVVCVWNALPASVVSAQSLEVFRSRLKPLSLC